MIALKILNAEHSDRIGEFEQRWRRIADFYGRRDWHPNLVKIFEPPFRGKLPHHQDDYCETGVETLYLPMEYIEGQSLRSHVMPPSSASPPFSVRRSYVRQLQGIAEGLAELASVRGSDSSSGSTLSKRTGLVHRDVKPDNIIFPPGRAPVLVDFGSMREMFTSRMYSGISGTEGYIAPEVTDHSIEWALRATPAVDLYGFACVVYFTLSRHDPPVQLSRWEHHLNTFLDSDVISPDTLQLLKTVLLEEDPESRLKIDVAEWSHAVTDSLFPGSATNRRSPTTPTHSPTKSSTDLTEPVKVTEQAKERESIDNDASSEAVRAAERRTTTGRKRGGRPGGRHTTSAPETPEPQSTANIGLGRDRNDDRRAEQVSSPPPPPSYIYLTKRGTIATVPTAAGGSGIITSGNDKYQYVLRKEHIPRYADSLAEFEPGKSVYFHTSDGINADYVNWGCSRLYSDGTEAPYKAPKVGFVVAAGTSMSVASSFWVASVGSSNHQPGWQIALITAVIAVISIVIATTMAESAVVPDGEYRTWWDDHHFGRIVAIVATVTTACFGAAARSAGLPAVDRLINYLAHLSDIVWLSTILRAIGFISPAICVLLVGSIWLFRIDGA